MTPLYPRLVKAWADVDANVQFGFNDTYSILPPYAQELNTTLTLLEKEILNVQNELNTTQRLLAEFMMQRKKYLTLPPEKAEFLVNIIHENARHEGLRVTAFLKKHAQRIGTPHEPYHPLLNELGQLVSESDTGLKPARSRLQYFLNTYLSWLKKTRPERKQAKRALQDAGTLRDRYDNAGPIPARVDAAYDAAIGRVQKNKEDLAHEKGTVQKNISHTYTGLFLFAQQDCEQLLSIFTKIIETISIVRTSITKGTTTPLSTNEWKILEQSLNTILDLLVKAPKP